MIFKSNSERETEQLGTELAMRLRPGDVVALFGELGAGKTAFCRGLARGLGLTQRVTSPTFTIVNEYEDGSPAVPMFHFDMYRLGGSDELFELGFDDYLERGGILAIEWSERIADALPPTAIRVKITRDSDEIRTIEVEDSDEIKR